MTVYVIDTSVLVKYVVPEENSPLAYGIIDAHQAAELSLIAPEYIMAECANVLWKHTRRNSLTAATAVDALRQLQSLNIPLTPQSELLEDALLFAAATGIAVYDALFCVLARRADAELITADLPLVNGLAGSGVSVCALHDWAPPE